MHKLIAAIALIVALTASVASAETVDCFYEANASHPACQK